MSLIIKTTPTIYGMAWRNDNDVGRQHVPFTNTTLNEKHNVHATTVVTPGTRMSIGYVCMGNAALRSGPDGADGSVTYAPVPHRARDANLFNKIPFVVKHEDDDLSPAQRLNYGMRVPLLIEGETYFAYYLKAIVDINNAENVIQEITVADDIITNIEPYTPNAGDLSPTKPVFDLNNAIPSESNYYQVTRPLDISFTSADVQNLTEALDIIYEDSSSKGLISEMGIVAGYRQSVPLLDGNRTPISGNYDECLRAIITDHINLKPTNFYAASEGASIVIDLGSTAPKLEASNL